MRLSATAASLFEITWPYHLDKVRWKYRVFEVGRLRRMADGERGHTFLVGDEIFTTS